MAGQHRDNRLLDRPVLAPFVVTVLGLALIVGAQVVFNRPSIENRLSLASIAALDASGVRGAQVTFSGRDADIVLAGGSVSDLARAQMIVANVTGVRVARTGQSGPVPPANAAPPVPSVPGKPATTAPVPTSASPVPPATPTATPTPASTSTPSASVTPPAPSDSVAKGRLPIGLTFKVGVLTVTGSVPSAAAHDGVISSVSSSGWTVVDRLQIDKNVPPASPAWIRSLRGLVSSVPLSTSLVVARYDGDQVICRGTPATSAIEFAILRAAATTVRGPSQVLDGLDVPGK